MLSVKRLKIIKIIINLKKIRVKNLKNLRQILSIRVPIYQKIKNHNQIHLEKTQKNQRPYQLSDQFHFFSLF